MFYDSYSKLQAKLAMKALCAALIAISVLASGCGKKLSEKEYIERAKQEQDKGDLRASIIDLKNALRNNPNNVEGRWLLGNIYLSVKDGSAAESELGKAHQLGISADALNVPLGESLLLQNKYKKLLDEIQPSSTTSALNQAKILRLRGDANLGLGRLEEGCSLYKQSIALDAKYVPTYWGLAMCAMARNDLVEARQQLDAALKVDQSNPDTWVFLGDFEQYNKNMAAAETDYSNALKAVPKHVTALLHRSLLYIQQGKLDMAQADLSVLEQLVPKHPLTHFAQAALLYSRANYAASLDNLEQILKSQPDFMPAVRLAGIVQYNLKTYEQSIRNLNRYLDSYPADLEVRKLLASAHLIVGEGKEALNLLKPVLDMGKTDDYQLLALAGQAYLKNKNPAAAAMQFEKAAAIDPKNVGLHTQLGLSLLSAGQSAQGIDELETAAKLDPGHYKADFTLLLIYLQQKQFDKALSAVAELEKKLPNDADLQQLKGAAYLGKNDLANARKSFENALEMRPTSAAAALNLAQLDLRDNNPQAARKRFEQILDKDKGNMQAMLGLAGLAAGSGKEQEYVEWLDKAAQSKPPALQPRLLLTRYYLGKNQLQKALTQARDAQTAFPESPEALELLGAAELKSGDTKNALAFFKKAVEAAPKSPSFYLSLASVQATLGQRDASRTSLNTALALNPDYVEAQVALIKLDVEANKYDEAMQVAKQIQTRHPQLAMGMVLQGDILMAQKRFAEALQDYKRAWQQGQSGLIAVKLHQALSGVGNKKEADTYLQHWTETHPKDIEARLYWARAYAERGERKQAIAQYQTVLQTAPGHLAALNNLAALYQEEGDPRARATAEEAYKLAPDNPAVADTLGWVLLQQGDATKGGELIQKAAAAAPDNPEIRYHLAMVLIKTGDRVQARKELKSLLDSGISFPQRGAAFELLKSL